jgi:hypothetical protein
LSNYTIELQMITKKEQKSADFFECEKCDVKCCKKSNWEKHLLTRKHQKSYTELQKSSKKVPTLFDCICGKEYSHRQGLYKHKKTCVYKNIIISPAQAPAEEVKTLTSMVVELMKSNSELQKQMMDMCKTSNTNINSHNTTNSHNKTFNLQFFLNEQCKDAMNINDFVSSFDLQLADLESVGELGYVDGITKIIVDKLNAMDIYKRPMHCSDAKRETIYIKDEDIWTKEGPGNPKLRQAIKKVSFNNMKLVYNWSNAYPESMDNKSRLNDTYIKLVLQSTGGSGPILESENKIIRRIAKEIVIDKL